MAEKNITLKDLIKDIDYRLTHLEDIEADNRQLMIKLVKQSNQVVEFLRDLQIDEVDPYDIPYNPPKPKDLENTRSIKDLVKEFLEKHKELKEFEEELEKHKLDITPGQVGDA